MCTASACASGGSSRTDATEQAAAATTQAEITQAATEPESLDPQVQAVLEKTAADYDFEGVIYAVRDGKTVASFAKGTQENGAAIRLDTPLPIGSVSKQFCAAAVLLLEEQGKLSVSDTLDKYYPGYAEGKNISLGNLLAMRAGIPDLNEQNGADVVSDDKTEQENIESIKQWVFAQPLAFQPDAAFSYCNVNYLLLSDIVSQVSGERYIDFLRRSFFEPLHMERTGSLVELPDSPAWAKGAVYQKVDTQPGLTNGCGDLVSNASDMTVWINALSSGTAISAESYRKMTTDYSPEMHYGYGMFLEIAGGVGHYGNIGVYSAFDYINAEKNFTLFVDSNTIQQPTAITAIVPDLLADLMQ